MPFKRTIEIGRVALCTYGPDAGKLFVIVDILDANRVVVDRPDITRKTCLTKRLAVTDLKADVTRLPKKTKLTAAFSDVDQCAPLDERSTEVTVDTFCFEKLVNTTCDIESTFAATSWGKKLIKRQAKAEMSDFDRFKAMCAKTSRSKLVRKAYAGLTN